MDNNSIEIYSEKGRKFYVFHRDNLLRLKNQHLNEAECNGCGSSPHNERQKKILDLIEILLYDPSDKRGIPDLAKKINVVSAKAREYLYQINYSMTNPK